MLKIWKTRMVHVPVKVVSLKRHDNPLNGEGLQSLRCTCCSHKLGNRGWGLAFIDDGTGKRGARLCFDCMEDAEAELSKKEGKHE